MAPIDAYRRLAALTEAEFEARGLNMLDCSDADKASVQAAVEETLRTLIADGEIDPNDLWRATPAGAESLVGDVHAVLVERGEIEPDGAGGYVAAVAGQTVDGLLAAETRRRLGFGGR